MKLLWEGFYVQNGTQFQMEFKQVQITSDQKIIGWGSDTVGDFQIIGQAQGTPTDATINFVKQYIGKHKIIYRGICKNGVIKGKWGFNQHQPEQQFMIQMRWPVQKLLWRGFYVQNGKQYPMEFYNVGISKDGTIQAMGSDAVGNFYIKGQAIGTPANSKIRFVKQYIEKHKITYMGQCNNGVVKGKWGFDESKAEEPFMIQMKFA